MTMFKLFTSGRKSKPAFIGWPTNACFDSLFSQSFFAKPGMPLLRTLLRPRNKEDGFTLLELLVVLGILALLAAIGYPQVLRYMGTARTETAKAQMSAIATSLELYALDNGGFPPQQAGLIALVQPPSGAGRWRGPYLKKAEGLIDPWGNPYQYRVPGEATPFELISLGRDNVPGGDGEDNDIVYR